MIEQTNEQQPASALTEQQQPAPATEAQILERHSVALQAHIAARAKARNEPVREPLFVYDH
jgi:hypothetical protein